MNYLLRSTNFGNEMVLTDAWSDDLVEIIAQENVVSLWVNYANGFVGDDLSFLSKVPNIRKLLVIHYGIDDLHYVNELHQLRSLVIGNRTFSGLTFSSFPRLEACGFDWQPNIKDFFTCQSLRRLNIGHYKEADLRSFSSLPNLVDLSVSSSPIRSLDGIGDIGGLKVLGLYSLRKLADITALSLSKTLDILEIDGCRSIGNIDALANLRTLRRLMLNNCGDIRSIAPIAKLTNLIDLMFDGTNVVDGDISLLDGLKNLEFTFFDNKRHYNRKSNQFPRAEMAKILTDPI